MALDDLVTLAPKSLRTAVWAIAMVLTIAGIVYALASAVDNKAKLEAAEAVAPLSDRVSKVEQGQGILWNRIDAKLDALGTQVIGMGSKIEVLSQRFDDQQMTQTVVGRQRVPIAPGQPR